MAKGFAKEDLNSITTPFEVVKKTKKKHHKKKEKLQILKYYKVEGDKVVRLKQMCKVCLPGTFIAEHADRLYCGRCK